MNSKHTTIRIFGQRSIASSFRSLPSNPSHDSKGILGNQASGKGKSVSLSEFLDRKLQKSSVLPGSVQGKSTPFQSPLGLKVSSVGNDGAIKEVEEETKSVNDKEIFEKFKHTVEEKGDYIGPDGVDEVENSITENMQESRKRKNPLEGRDENHTVREQVVVLGGESKFRQNRKTESYTGNKKPKPLFNHYTNGCGWWDCDMEGVDNGEVDFSEIWEGVGSTSLGGIIDWH